MKLLANAHTHTTLCDGADTPRAMVEAALALGFHDLGFSAHSPAPFDPSCPGLADEDAYRSEIAALAAEYAGRITLTCGIEQEFFAPVVGPYAYRIGSVHYVRLPDGQLVSVDNNTEELAKARDEGFGGDIWALLQAYYALEVENAVRYRPEIVGHYDVVVKTNRDGCFFDEDSPRYREIALAAADAVADTVLGYGGIVEINTGGMAKGYRTNPYPALFILRHLAQRGVRITVNSDSHSVKTLDYGFEGAVALARKAGFTSLVVLTDGRFVDVKLPG